MGYTSVIGKQVWDRLGMGALWFGDGARCRGIIHRRITRFDRCFGVLGLSEAREGLDASFRVVSFGVCRVKMIEESLVSVGYINRIQKHLMRSQQLF